MGMKKYTSLRMAFWKFLFCLLIGIVGVVLILFEVFMLAVSGGIATFANYSEQNAKQIAPIIAIALNVSEVQLPAGSRYLRLNKNYQIIETTLESDELKGALIYAKTGQMVGDGKRQYLLITRDDEYFILQYYIGSQFTNDWLNRNLPSPETILYILIVFNCILVCVFLTARFAKTLSRELKPLFEATEEVAAQNLDFEIGHSKIKEFEEMLVAFADMRDDLKDSLETQWRTEQSQKEQIAALAHDLKTPLTIIQGNADLLSETDLSKEQESYVNYIEGSSKQMQEYIKILIDLSRASVGYLAQKEMVNCKEYLAELGQKIDVLCNTKGIVLQMTIAQLPDTIEIDKLLLERAIMNVVNNALDYAPSKSTIYVSAQTVQGYLQITVRDEGNGFSKEALLYAKEQFFMDDQSRSSKMHYGMGLFIAESIAKLHGGGIELKNSEVTCGAEVILQISL